MSRAVQRSSSRASFALFAAVLAFLGGIAGIGPAQGSGHAAPPAVAFHLGANSVHTSASAPTGEVCAQADEGCSAPRAAPAAAHHELGRDRPTPPPHPVAVPYTALLPAPGVDGFRTVVPSREGAAPGHKAAHRVRGPPSSTGI
ncbi:hypothetical protein [Streptomyces sp. ODS28]|uniref:hypothetical protein n=1 Tax=Streptomyces sp. ODS28 TaxID=3136688 RepID=UPI0031EDED5D